MKWAFLLTAILLEICGTTCMKLSFGMTRLVPTIAMFLLYVGSFSTLALALKQWDISVAYAIWAGLGTAIIAVIGILIFRESYSLFKCAGIFLVIVGIVMINLAGGNH
jgi:small multidrug resistance pump